MLRTSSETAAREQISWNRFSSLHSAIRLLPTPGGRIDRVAVHQPTLFSSKAE
jgi:hypothetical protein